MLAPYLYEIRPCIFFEESPVTEVPAPKFLRKRTATTDFFPEDYSIKMNTTLTNKTNESSMTNLYSQTLKQPWKRQSRENPEDEITIPKRKYDSLVGNSWLSQTRTESNSKGSRV